MKQAVFAAILTAAVPFAAMAQSDGLNGGGNALPPRGADLANPQDHDNQRMQPRGAQQDPSSGQATAMPTPTLGRPMTPSPATTRP